jgi:hypothetical protein
MRKYAICRGPPLHIADAPFWRTDVSPPSLNNRRKHSSNSLPQQWSKPVLTSKKRLIVCWRLLAQQRNKTVVSSAVAVVCARIECTAIGCRSVIYKYFLVHRSAPCTCAPQLTYSSARVAPQRLVLAAHPVVYLVITQAARSRLLPVIDHCTCRLLVTGSSSIAATAQSSQDHHHHHSRTKLLLPWTTLLDVVLFSTDTAASPPQ